ncbi:MAG: hypothetical protein CMJ83_02610 [Planctomycetes bacterium]|nr:hypothetical protein [Planctomycetota bacterium]
MRNPATLWATVLLMSASLAAQDGVHYAMVTGDKVRVRGGPADLHAVLGLMKKGTTVKVVGADDDWRRVEIPGGLPVWVHSGKGDKKYLREPSPGEGVVLVNDLMIRGAANTDYPPIGRLSAGARVVVLDKTEQWARLLSPAGTKTWIHGAFLKRVDDQAASEKTWAADHVRSRRLILESGALSRQLAARDAEEKIRADKARGAFASYDVERAKPWDQRDTKLLRVSLAQVQSEAPAGHPDRIRAESLIQTLDHWDRTSKELVAAKSRFAEAEAEAQAAETRYAGSLEELREAKKRMAAAPEKGAEPKSRYRASGHVGRALPISGIGNSPFYALTRGGKTIFYLESHRYDLGDFEGKLIGVLVSDEPDRRPDVSARVLRVKRIEILDG